MMRLALAAAGLAALIGLSGQAAAADLGRPMMPVKAPYMAPVYNWTGFYVGIQGGGGWGDSRWTGIAPSFDTSGGLIGGTVGYNWQMQQNIVLGLEGDANWSNIRGTGPCLVVGGCQTKSDWFGTARGRVGVAFDRFMPYVTGGLAFGDITGTSAFGTGSDTKAGWAAGAGLEFAIAGPWSAKVEYMHIDLGKFTCATCTPVPTNVNFNADIVRGGINVRF